MATIKSARAPVLFAVGVWLAALAVGTGLDLGSRMEYPFLDSNLRSLAARTPPDPDIVLLDIDEPTLEAMSHDYGRYPWTRAVYGQLVEGLARQKPRAIVFDILLVDPHKEHADDDAYLVRVAQRTPNVFFPMVRLPGTAENDAKGFPLKNLKGVERTASANPETRVALLLPLPGLRETGRVGTINAWLDVDARVRRYPLYQGIDGWRIPSMPARVAKELGYTIPDTDSFALVWHGPAHSYRTISLHEVLADLERSKPQRPANEFADKIVLIGGSAPSLFDIKLTPMGANYPGAEVIATAIDNLKNGERLTFAPAWTGLALTALLLAILTTAFLLRLGILQLGALTLALTVALGVGGWASVVYGRHAVPVVLPIVFGGWFYYLLAALQAWILERRDRQRVTQLFSRFLDPRIVTDLVARGGTEATMAGQKREITVLFSDIRGFTTLSEQKSPQQVVEILNRYFHLQVEVIFRHQGTLDKYIGDAIMAFWGAPTDQPDHARRALAAARDMEQTLAQFQRELGPAGKNFDVGIGLSSGEAIVGFIGSPEHRQDYTVIGDTVNTASRIEGATKDRARILVSDSTRNAIESDAGAGVKFRDHGLVALKGKGVKVRLFEPVFD